MEKDKKVVLSFGELLLRFCPDTEGHWLQQNNLPFYVGGAEANVASALALWQVPVAYVSRVPDNLIGRQVTGYLAVNGIDTSHMQWGGEKLGYYFLPRGNDLKHAAVIYDRAHSSFSQLQPGMIDWDAVLKNIGWLHFSAISPAINSKVADVCKEAAAAAMQKGIPVSLDLNYRPKLWQWGKEPAAVIPELLPYCNVVMGNIWAAEKMVGCEIDHQKIAAGSKETYLEQARQVGERIRQQFTNVHTVANTFRFNQDTGPLRYYATLAQAHSFLVSAEYRVESPVDNVGSGDCFMAGLIYGFLKNLLLQQTLDFATAAAIKKLSEAGDATRSTVAQIQQTIKPYDE